MDVGTSYEDLALPETVAVKLESQDTLELPVAWNGVYDSQTEGTYELYGIVDVQDLCLNTQGLKAGIRINVSSAAEIDTAEAPASVQVNYCLLYTSSGGQPYLYRVLTFDCGNGLYYRAGGIFWSGTPSESHGSRP